MLCVCLHASTVHGCCEGMDPEFSKRGGQNLGFAEGRG